MLYSVENALLISSLLLLISLLLGSTTYRFGIPTLLLFLVVGMVSGSEGLGGIPFDDPALARFIGIVALNFILFNGGLETRWSTVKPVVGPGLLLSTLGVLITAVSVGIFLWQISDWSLYEGLLVGAIVSSTDAAAVFSILRARNLPLRSRLKPLLELESGSNDPMAYVLTVTFLSLVQNPDENAGSVFIFFLQNMMVGALTGLASGRLSPMLINGVKLGFEGLYPVLMIALMFLTFSTAEFLGGNGFLAIYIAAVHLANKDLLHKKTILKVFDGLAWLMQIALFLSLGLLVFPSRVWAVAPLGLLVAGFLILVARPLGVFISLIPYRLDAACKTFVAWVGLRGAVPIVFATYPFMAGLEKADLIFNVVFFVSVSSLVVQGSSIPAVARWLGLHKKPSAEEDTESPLLASLEETPRALSRDVQIKSGDFASKKRIVDLHFPESVFIVLLKRGGRFLRPGGSTVLQADDVVTLLADRKEDLDKATECLRKGKEIAEKNIQPSSSKKN